MRYLYAFPLVAIVAACGADGDPVRPSVSTTIGIGSDGNVSTATSVSATTGSVTVAIGL